MIEKILKISPFIAGVVGAILLYFKGYKDRKSEEADHKAKTLEEYSKIDREKPKKDDIYKSSKW